MLIRFHHSLGLFTWGARFPLVVQILADSNPDTKHRLYGFESFWPIIPNEDSCTRIVVLSANRILRVNVIETSRCDVIGSRIDRWQSGLRVLSSLANVWLLFGHIKKIWACGNAIVADMVGFRSYDAIHNCKIESALIQAEYRSVKHAYYSLFGCTAVALRYCVTALLRRLWAYQCYTMPCISDIFYYMAIGFLDLVDFDYSEYKKVTEWRAKIAAKPWHQEVWADNQAKLKEFFASKRGSAREKK